MNNILVLWARSEPFGYTDFYNCLNSKHEIRNTKQYQMTQIGMIKTNRIAFKPMGHVWGI